MSRAGDNEQGAAKLPRVESVIADGPPDLGEHYRAFRIAADSFERFLSMIEVRLRTGNRLLFAYHFLARAEWNPSSGNSPGQVWKHGKTAVKTLWGELAWQLGGADGFSLVKDADANGTTPGKEVLRQLLADYAPCIVLMDELVAYIRQFSEGAAISGGTYDSNRSFLQVLTEA